MFTLRSARRVATLVLTAGVALVAMTGTASAFVPRGAVQLVDTNGDGLLDTYMWDSNGDRILDSYVWDTNRDGWMDVWRYTHNQVEKLAVDSNFDRYFDRTYTCYPHPIGCREDFPHLAGAGGGGVVPVGRAGDAVRLYDHALRNPPPGR